MTAASDQVRGWLAELDAIERDGAAAVAGLTNDAGSRRPAPGKWSVAECVAHLRHVGTLVLERLEPGLLRARQEGLTSDRAARLGLIGGWFTRSMEPDGVKRMPAPANFVPPSDIPLDAAVQAWRIYHARLRRAIESAEGLALEKIRVRSTAKGSALLSLNAAAWIASTLAHERRHIAQMRRVRDALQLIASRTGSPLP
jgi:hypothetical protein